MNQDKKEKKKKKKKSVYIYIYISDKKWDHCYKQNVLTWSRVSVSGGSVSRKLQRIIKLQSTYGRGPSASIVEYRQMID